MEGRSGASSWTGQRGIHRRPPGRLLRVGAGPARTVSVPQVASVTGETRLELHLAMRTASQTFPSASWTGQSLSVWSHLHASFQPESSQPCPARLFPRFLAGLVSVMGCVCSELSWLMEGRVFTSFMYLLLGKASSADWSGWTEDGRQLIPRYLKSLNQLVQIFRRSPKSSLIAKELQYWMFLSGLYV